MTTLYTTEICLHFGFCQKISNMKCPTLVAFQQHNGTKKNIMKHTFFFIATHFFHYCCQGWIKCKKLKTTYSVTTHFCSKLFRTINQIFFKVWSFFICNLLWKWSCIKIEILLQRNFHPIMWQVSLLVATTFRKSFPVQSPWINYYKGWINNWY